MKISIITPTFNSDKIVDRNVNSILGQSYNNYEHIIIDNLSSDNTILTIKNLYENSGNTKRLNIISEKDNGISDAFNKGIKIATGQYAVTMAKSILRSAEYLRLWIRSRFIFFNNFFLHRPVSSPYFFFCIWCDISFLDANCVAFKYISFTKASISDQVGVQSRSLAIFQSALES